GAGGARDGSTGLASRRHPSADGALEPGGVPGAMGPDQRGEAGGKAAGHVGPVKFRGVLAGESIVLPVEGGFRRQPAPCDGYYLDSDWPEFIPAADLEQARDALHSSVKVRSAGKVLAAQSEQGKRHRAP